MSPGNPLLPAREATLIHFVTPRSSSVSHGTIRVYLAAVKNLHVEFGYSLDFTSMPLLYKTLRGIRTSLGTPKRTSLPITISILHSIHDKLKLGHSLDPDSSMLWAAFTLAFLVSFAAVNSLAVVTLTLPPICQGRTYRFSHLLLIGSYNYEVQNWPFPGISQAHYC